jgi:hypothetical protein
MTLLAPAVRADEQTEFALHFGKGTLNVGKASPAGTSSVSGSAFGLRYLHSLTDFTAVGIDTDFIKSGEAGSSVVTNAESTFSAESSSVYGVIRCGNTEEKIRPNFLFGVGIHVTGLKLDSKPLPGFVWTDTSTSEKRTLVNSTGVAPAVKLQGGADYALTQNWLAGAYLAFNYFGSATYGTTDQARAVGVNSAKGTMTAISGGLVLSARF